MAPISFIISALVLSGLVSTLQAKNACPCSDPSLCKPPNVPDRPELLGFITSGENWKYYNYTYVTTIAVFAASWDPQLICYAHEKKVRVVLASTFDSSQVTDPEYRKQWVQNETQRVQAVYADGLNVDFEGPIFANQTTVNAAFVQLMADLNTTLKAQVPGSLLTIDVAWSPACIDGRCFDHYNIAKHVDLMVLMAYDESSQILGPCIALANSPIQKTMQGLLEYINNGIPRDKLVLAVPWYGYDYTCTSLSTSGDCSLSEVPFRGIPCSDAAGVQRSSTDMIFKYLKQSYTGRVWNNTMKTPFFNYKDSENKYHQAWFDDPESLAYKYYYASQAKIRGLGIWTFECLIFQDDETKEFNIEMWSMLDHFFMK